MKYKFLKGYINMKVSIDTFLISVKKTEKFLKRLFLIKVNLQRKIGEISQRPLKGVLCHQIFTI